MNGATDKNVAELKERIQALEKELDNANELLSSSKFRGQLAYLSCNAGFQTMWKLILVRQKSNLECEIVQR